MSSTMKLRMSYSTSSSLKFLLLCYCSIPKRLDNYIINDIALNMGCKTFECDCIWPDSGLLSILIARKMFYHSYLTKVTRLWINIFISCVCFWPGMTGRSDNLSSRYPAKNHPRHKALIGQELTHKIAIQNAIKSLN